MSLSCQHFFFNYATTCSLLLSLCHFHLSPSTVINLILNFVEIFNLNTFLYHHGNEFNENVELIFFCFDWLMDVNICCVLAASEPQTGDGEEVVGGELGELQTTVCEAQVEGEPSSSARRWEMFAVVLHSVCNSLPLTCPTAVIQNSGFVQSFNADHEEEPQAAWAGRGKTSLTAVVQCGISRLLSQLQHMMATSLKVPANLYIYIFKSCFIKLNNIETYHWFQRDCESDQEEDVLKRRPRTRKRSSTSWEQRPASSLSVNRSVLVTVTLHLLGSTHTEYHTNAQTHCSCHLPQRISHSVLFFLFWSTFTAVSFLAQA